jgi:hypothetical protein
MNVLVACEYSGIVRNAFRARGHNAMSCDLEPTESPGPHYQGDVRDTLDAGWDLMIAHPPCTYLCNSGVKWLYKDGCKVNGEDPERWRELRQGAQFFRQLLDAPIAKKCIENPIMHKHAKSRIQQNHTQIIQPWQFGHGETKATCLWLDDLEPLVPTDIVDGREGRVWKLGPSPDRWKLRSTTLQGIADAMAEQWGAQ